MHPAVATTGDKCSRISKGRRICYATSDYDRKILKSQMLMCDDVGDTLLLNCPFKGVPAPTIEWSSYTKGNFSKYKFINSTQLWVVANETLELSDLTPLDKGAYACMASNRVGSDTVYIVLCTKESNRFRELCSIDREKNLKEFHLILVQLSFWITLHLMHVQHTNKKSTAKVLTSVENWRRKGTRGSSWKQRTASKGKKSKGQAGSKEKNSSSNMAWLNKHHSEEAVKLHAKN